MAHDREKKKNYDHHRGGGKTKYNNQTDQKRSLARQKIASNQQESVETIRYGRGPTKNANRNKENIVVKSLFNDR